MTPKKEQFAKCAESANVIPVYAEILADMETPVSVFSKLEGVGECFLLESAENINNWGRYSFIGCSPRAVFVLNGKKSKLKFADGRFVESESEDGLEPLAPLRNFIKSRKIAEIEGLPRFFGGAVGYFGYECVGLFERLPEPKGERLWDDARLAVYDDIIIFDNLRHSAKIVACSHVDEYGNVDDAYADACARIERLLKVFKRPRAEKRALTSDISGVELKSEMGRDEFCSMVSRAKEYIAQGEIIQVVPSQKFSAKADIRDIDAYRVLRLINPSPYMFCLRFEGRSLVGSSPETLLRFSDGRAQLRPIAGTRRRGADENEDMKLADELLSNEKERAEHLMLVDLGRNDLSRFCEAGSVQVGDFMGIERYSHVMHMVSDVSGQVKSGVDAFDALAAVFPAGTLSGAPKIRAMEIISELEPCRRGPYGGAVGYIGYSGNMDLAITIRTLQMMSGVISVQAGAGIVYESSPEGEYQETIMKARALARAVGAAGKIESLDLSDFRK